MNDKCTVLIHCVNIFTFRHHRSSLTTIETILKPFVLNYLFKPNNQNEAFCELIFKPTIIRFYPYFLAIRLMASLISEAKAKHVNAIVIVCVTDSFNEEMFNALNCITLNTFKINARQKDVFSKRGLHMV